MDKLGNILPKIVRRQPGGARLMGMQVATAFRHLMGPDVAGLCDEVELRSGTLLVTTSSPALAHHADFRAAGSTPTGRLSYSSCTDKPRI